MGARDSQRRPLGRGAGEALPVAIVPPSLTRNSQGYSYGSLIASLQPVLPGITTSHILLSYPMGVRGWLTLFSSRYKEKLNKLLHNPAANVLVVFGDRDEFTSAASYRAWRGGLEAEKIAGKLECVEVEGGTHFWRDADADALVEIVSRSLP